MFAIVNLSERCRVLCCDYSLSELEGVRMESVCVSAGWIRVFMLYLCTCLSLSLFICKQIHTFYSYEKAWFLKYRLKEMSYFSQSQPSLNPSSHFLARTKKTESACSTPGWLSHTHSVATRSTSPSVLKTPTTPTPTSTPPTPIPIVQAPLATRRIAWSPLRRSRGRETARTCPSSPVPLPPPPRPAPRVTSR